MCKMRIIAATMPPIMAQQIRTLAERDYESFSSTLRRLVRLGLAQEKRVSQLTLTTDEAAES